MAHRHVKTERTKRLNTPEVSPLCGTVHTRPNTEHISRSRNRQSKHSVHSSNGHRIADSRETHGRH
jgi:hypothetical protein